MSYRLILIILSVSLVELSCGQPTYRNQEAKLNSVSKKVALDRYLGFWYEIYRIPNRFEDKNHEHYKNVTANYSMNPNGSIKVENRCEHEDGKKECARGIAHVVDNESNSKLEVSFFRPFYGDYWILDLADDYSWAIVGEPKGKFLWILSRSKTMDPDTENLLLDKIEALGYNKTDLIKTIHD